MNVRKKNVDGFELSFSSNWIKHLEAQEHWGFYWHQARLIQDRVPQDSQMLEIGVGTKFLSNYLASRGRSITTLDIDENKAPDYVEDASSFDYGALNLDTVIAFELFEHLPFPLFCRVIKRLAECNVNQIVFSVPWCEKKLLRGQIKLPRMNPYRFALTLPWRSVTTENHFWELDPVALLNRGRPVEQVSNEKVLIPLKQVLAVFEAHGYGVCLEKKVDYIQFFSADKL
jgi:hypothetical protein